MKVQNIFCILIGIVLVLTVFSATALAGSGSSNGEVTRLLVDGLKLASDKALS